MSDTNHSNEPAFVNVRGTLFNLHHVKKVEYKNGHIEVTVMEGDSETTYVGPDNGAFDGIRTRFSVNR